MRFPALFATLALLLLLAACGGDGSDDEDEQGLTVLPAGLEVHDAWVRPAVLPEGSPTPDPDHHDHDHDHGSGVLSAMYMTVSNGASQAVQLVGVETDIAGITELHETRDENGLMRMRQVEQVEVPAGGEVVFEPGGLHIMLVDITRPLEEGDEVAVTLVFNTGERVELPNVPVQHQNPGA